MKLIAGFAAALLLTSAALADAGDPPSRVARLNYSDGTVSYKPAGTENWTDAQLNDPLIGGDRLWTSAGARAELHIGSAALRLNAETLLGFSTLDDRGVQVSLPQGSLVVRLRDLPPGETFEIDTPNAAITLIQPGEYRIDADPDAGRTSVTVRQGEAEINAGAATNGVRPRQTARITGENNPVTEISPALWADAWERWCEDRDRREDQSVSAQYVGREMTGYEDLDAYGSWREMPEYGPVWIPSRVDAGWAPYRYGHWRYIEPWGWTWVDDAAWGFAPFHYGRWANTPYGWVWVPGARVARPVYAPALVAFVGGPHLNISVGIGGGVAWFPLGPREVYRPAYRVSETYVRSVNVTHVTNINVTNVRYVNQNVNGAVTAAPPQVFAGGQSIRRSAIVVSQRDVVQARVAERGPEVAPPPRSMVPPRAAAPPPTRVVDRQVYSRGRAPMQPPAQPSQSQPVRIYQPQTQPQPQQQMQQPAPAPRPERPARIERPAQPDRPSQPERPARIERPIEQQRPPERRMERPAEQQRPPEQRQERRVERPAEQRQERREERRNPERKVERKDPPQQ